MKNKPELRSFTDSDWDAFSGCETEKPMVAYGAHYTLVVDGAGVEFISDPEGGEGPTFSGIFRDPGLALRVAYAIIASPTRGVVTALLDHWGDGYPDDGQEWWA